MGGIKLSPIHNEQGKIMYSINNRVQFPENKSIENFNHTQKCIFRCLESQLYSEAPIVPFVKSPPGTGKTDMFSQIASMFKWDYREVILSRYSAVELHGLFVPNHTTKSLEHYPLKRITGDRNTDIPTLVLLDEITAAEKDVQAALQSALQSRIIEGTKISNNIMFGAAGNGSEDGCNTEDLSRAMLEGRLLTINHYPDAEEWIKNYAIPNDVNPYIISYIEWQKESLYNYDPNSSDDAQPTCRGWDKLGAIHKVNIENDSYINMVLNCKVAEDLGSGCIGRSEYEKYKSFVGFSHRLPSWSSISSNPIDAKLPDGMGEQWAIIANITSELTYIQKRDKILEDYEVDNLCKYIDRLPQEFIGLACHSIGKINNQVRDSAMFSNLIEKYTTNTSYSEEY
jgi:hypothetical protein